jgi:hypothetical protein
MWMGKMEGIAWAGGGLWRLQVNIVDMLVTLSANPETMNEVICDLGKRHVTYGVASHHVPVMKQVKSSSFVSTQGFMKAECYIVKLEALPGSMAEI